MKQRARRKERVHMEDAHGVWGINSIDCLVDNKGKEMTMEAKWLTNVRELS